jgi:mannose-1-phosphate guanylyltransferase
LPIAGETPKQFAPKFNDVTFVQDIEEMIAKAGFKPSRIIVVVTNEKQKKFAEEQLGPKGVPSTNIVEFDPHYGYVAVQAKAVAYVAQHDPEAICFLSPSDQSITGQDRFNEAIDIAYQYAEEGIPVQIGDEVFPDAGGDFNRNHAEVQGIIELVFEVTEVKA